MSQLEIAELLQEPWNHKVEKYAKVLFVFSISVCNPESALISLDCMGEYMVVDIYEEASSAIEVNYHLEGFVIKSCGQDN